MSIKTSYGIALCRKNTNCIEVIMVKKRYTYHFFNFVFGRYKNNDATLKEMFDHMSFAEKIDIVSLQFEQMWYRIWLANPKKNFDISDEYSKKTTVLPLGKIYETFYSKQERFHKNFLQDHGRRLKKLVSMSQASEIPWEFPRGGKQNDETDLDCAIREFGEETGINSEKYRILSQTPIVQTTKDGQIFYKHIYFLAEPIIPINEPKINYNSFEQISEIETVGWVSYNELSFNRIPLSVKKQNLALYRKIISSYKKRHRI